MKRDGDKYVRTIIKWIVLTGFYTSLLRFIVI